jgi:hypothetical protein
MRKPRSWRRARRFPPGRRGRGASAVALLRRVAALIEERVYWIGAALALEVGKNRMEALGEAQETADLIRWYCDRMEAHDGFTVALPPDPLPGFAIDNRSVLKPYGAWLIIAPFNFPLALTGGPAGAALVAGNTVVCKSASATPWSGRLLADAMRDAGIPDGVYNYVTGPGESLGQALVDGRCRRRHVHRQLRGGYGAHAAHGGRSLAAAVHRGAGRQERGDRHAARGSSRRGRRRRARRVRAIRSEVLRMLARVRRAPGVQRFRFGAARRDRAHRRRRSRRCASTGWGR